MKNSLVYLLLIFSWISRGYAQELSQRFVPLTSEQGLSQNTVSAITQDKYGFIWIGTLDGLNRYDGLSFKTYSNNPNDTTSLPSATITALLNSSTDTLWVGTNKGLVTYYEVYDSFSSVTSLNYTERINALFEDSNGTIWVSVSTRGVFRKRKSSQSFETFSFPKSTFQQKTSTISSFTDTLSTAQYTITSFEEDALGNLWMGTALKGIVRYSPNQKSVTHFDSEEDNPNSLAGNSINQLSAGSNHVWFATDGGLSSFDIHKEQFTNYLHDSEDPYSLPNNMIYMVKVTHDNKVWVSADGGGLSLLHPKENKFTSFKYTSSDPNSISNDDLNCIFEDRLHNLWIGTYNGGINKYQPYTPFQHYKQNTDKETYLSSNFMRKIITDEDGFIWAATTSAGLNRINPTTQEVYTFTSGANQENGLTENRVNQVFQDAFGDFWIGLANQGLDKLEITYGENQSIEEYEVTHFNAVEGNDSTLAGSGVLAIVAEHDTAIWVGSYGGITLVNPQKNTLQGFRKNENDINHASNQVRALAIDSKNHRLWVGTAGGGVLLFNTKTRQFITSYVQRDDATNSVSSNNVNTIHFDENNNALWLGTSGYGLNRIDLRTDSVKIYTTENGLSNNYIYGILQDGSDNLWLSTNKGLTMFSSDGLNAKVYTQDDGLQNNEFNVASYHRDETTGRMFFGGINGFNIFHPDSLKPEENPPTIVFTDFLLFNTSVEDYRNTASVINQYINTLNTVTLSNDEAIFSIEFAALHHGAPEANQYKYRLEGFNEDWIALGTDNSVTFTNLDPKTYTFRVKAANSDGIWTPDGRALKIIVTPPWWETWWARAVAIAVLVALIFLMYRYRTVQLKKRNILLENEVKARTQQIREKQQEILSQNETLAFKNKQINLSIHAAQNIQQAFLPSDSFFSQHFQEHFILFRPRDIVSGDFYWVSQQQNTIWLAVSDCTGHGVPGAFMTLLGKNLLDKLIIEKKENTPAAVLEKLNEEVQISLRQQETRNDQGMDIILVKITKAEDGIHSIAYAGAKNPLYIIPPNYTQLVTLNPNQRSIGGIRSNPRKISFTNQSYQASEGTKVYLATDGYQDQNDRHRKRFMKHEFTDLLLSTATHSLKAQKDNLELTLDSYMENTSQRDDILLLGLML